MSKYKYNEIPKDVVKLAIRRWGCGDICCCNYFWIQGITNREQVFYNSPSLAAYDLWEGMWWNSDCLDDKYGYTKEEIIEDLIEACKHYGIPTDKLTVENFWDLEDIENVIT